MQTPPTPEPTKTKRRVSLDVIDVAEPCTEDWDAMIGDDRVRFCGLCEKNVFHLSAMSADEIDALFEERASQGLCVRFYRRADGTATASDCAPDRLAAMRRKARRGLGLAAAGLAGVFTLVTGMGAAAVFGTYLRAGGDEPCDLGYEVMGEAPSDAVLMGEPMDMPPELLPGTDGDDPEAGSAPTDDDLSDSQG